MGPPIGVWYDAFAMPKDEETSAILPTPILSSGMLLPPLVRRRRARSKIPGIFVLVAGVCSARRARHLPTRAKQKPPAFADG